MPPNPPRNSRLPRLAVWSGYGTVCPRYSLTFDLAEDQAETVRDASCFRSTFYVR